jgi:tetratricopeptide (TPR) repeat protein
VRRRTLALIGLPVLTAVALAASAVRIPDDRALVLRWPLVGHARIVTSSFAAAPPGLVRREWLERRDGAARAAGTLQAATREGISVTAAWEASLAPGPAPSGPEGTLARLAKDLGPLIVSRVVARSGMASGEEVILAAFVADHPAWRDVLRSLTLHVELPERTRRAVALAALRGSVADTGRRLAVIGWDGADWELLDRLAAEGRLPNLKRLIARGATARLEALRPLISPLIWTSIATGVSPEVHGIYDFLRPSPIGGGTEPITSFDRQAPALWNIATALGRSVGVVGWWATWPAEPVEGFVISDRVAYQLSGYESSREREGLFYPAGDAVWLLPMRRDENDVNEAEIGSFVEVPAGALALARATGRGYDEPLVHLARVLASTDTYHRMTLAAVRRYRPGLLLAYVEGTDTIGHLFGAYTPPRRPHVSPQDVRRFGQAADRFYAKADRQLGELLEVLGPETTVLLCSDHGFTWGDDRPREASGTHTPTAAWWHRPEGVLVMAGPRVRHVAARGHAHVLDLAPTVAAIAAFPAATSWPGRSLDWALEPGERPAQPVDWMALLPPQSRPESAADDPNAREYVARLRALGYIGSDAALPERPAVTPTPAETLSALMNRGSVLLDRGDTAGALSAYRRATELSGGVPGPWLKLAVAQHKAEDRLGALESYRRAAALAREHAHRESAFLGEGIMLAELGRAADAIEVLQAGVRELPDSFMLWSTLGGLHLSRRELPLARAAFGEATKLKEDPETLNSLAALEIAVGGDTEAARRLWRRSLQLRPGQPDVERALGELGEGANR